MSDELSEILSPSPRLALADQVVSRLREAIMEGTLPPGEPLRESALAAALGVSRGPVREAISRLEREGLVVVRPNRSALVARLSREDLEEVYSLRAALERLAAQRVYQAAEPEHVARLQEVVSAMSRAAGSSITAPEAATLDLGFHDTLFEASGHSRLIGCWSDLKPQIYVFLLHRNTANPDFARLLARGHQEIIDTLTKGTEAELLEIVNKHHDAGYRRVLAAYEQSAHGAASSDTAASS
jgi:DNA-binding GntR family transcriptional regulator